MKIAFRILIGVIALAVLAFGALAYSNRPMKKIENRVRKLVEKNDSLSSVLLTIYSNKTGYFEQFAAGARNKTSDQPARIDSRYHSASIGKTMLATVYGMLADQGRIGFDDTIDTWLSADILQGLFEIDGTNYSGQVTIRQLLSHTSGVGDYFEGPVTSGQPMLALITANPDLSFTPQDLIAFTRDNQEPIAKPGQRFYYSDTGYLLLGLALEAIEGKSVGSILEERIFEPLGMKDSLYWMERDAPADLLGIYVNGVDFSDKKALSVDWSGGGVATTMNDLLTFMKALAYGELVSEEVFAQMTDFRQRYDKGIHYGLGMMEFDFSELSFLLKFSGITDVYGAVGATGTYALYDKANDTFFVANFGSLDFAEKSIEELVKIRMIYDRIKAE